MFFPCRCFLEETSRIQLEKQNELFQVGGSTTSKDDCGWCFFLTISSKLLSCADSIMVFVLDHIWLLKGTVVGRNPAPFYVRRFRFLFFTWFNLVMVQRMWNIQNYELLKFDAPRKPRALQKHALCNSKDSCMLRMACDAGFRPLAVELEKPHTLECERSGDWKLLKDEIHLGWDGLTVGGWGGSHWRHRFWCARLERGRSVRLWQWAYYLLGLLLVRGRYSRQQVVDVDMCLCLHTCLYIYKT